MKVLVTGAGGQLGRELLRPVPTGAEVVGLGRDGLDICDPAAVDRALDGGWDLVVNAAAYTAVDRAEAERDAAFAINATGAGLIAEACAARGVRLIHISTDFIFDGTRSSPYRPADPPNPLSVYGASKLAGEKAVLEASGGKALVLRTAWVYSVHGRNFVQTMLRLLGERESVGVVADQVGTPTWAGSLAQAVWAAAARPEVCGVHHFTDAGVASWYDLAVAVAEEAVALGLLARAGRVRPIRTEDYPTPARRPAYSVLEKADTWAALGIEGRHWREALREMMKELKDA